MRTHKLFPSILVLLATRSVHAEFYYVDQTQGNDSWSGRLQSPSGSDGPWQSLKRVSIASLKPGDEVRLACNQRWRETLKVGTDGTSASPIVIRSWPHGCAQPPVIDGAFAVPSFLWTYDGAYQWQAPLNLNLVRNGSGSAGTHGWRTWSLSGQPRLQSISADCPPLGSPCIHFASSAQGDSPSTVYTYDFPIDSGRDYEVSFWAKAPTTITYRSAVRMSMDPWPVVPSSMRQFQGSSTWTHHTYTFRSDRPVNRARFELEIPSIGTSMLIALVRVSPIVSSVYQVLEDGSPLTPAHHPNRGFDSARPQSLYFRLPRNADVRQRTEGTVTKSGSSFLPIGLDAVSTPMGNLVGAKVRMRTTPWTLEERTITSQSGSSLFLNSDTDFPLTEGFGYFFLGQRWMLDSPGEWTKESSTNRLSVQMRDSAFPGNRISVVGLEKGIDVSGRSHLRLSELVVQNTFLGIDASFSNGIVVSDSHVSQTVDEGIDLSGATTPTIRESRFLDTGGDAIGFSKVGIPSTGAVIVNNTVTNSSFGGTPDAPTMLPTGAIAAIRSGNDAIVRGNSIRNAAYNGITGGRNAVVDRNTIEATCLVLDDCGGIYVFGRDLNTTISSNTIHNLVGTDEGKPPNEFNKPHTVGIYLDEHSSRVRVTGNIVSNAQYGIQLHNAFDNDVSQNHLYGNRTYQLWLQAGRNEVKSSGDVFGNVINSNTFVPTEHGVSVSLDSLFDSTDDFAHFDANLYSALRSAQIVRERTRLKEILYSFASWTQARTMTGVSRGIEITGKQVAATGYASHVSFGPNLVPNADFSLGLGGWSAWTSVQPAPVLTVEPCDIGRCLKLSPGGSYSLVASPNFSVQAGSQYRFSVDLKGTISNQKVIFIPRRGGGGSNLYEPVSDRTFELFVQPEWRRFSGIFLATKTVQANDPQTKDNGARLDVQQVQVGRPIDLRNLQLVQVRSAGTTLRTHLLANSTPQTIPFECPDARATPIVCSQYVRFDTGVSIRWPVSVAPFEALVIYTRDTSLVDEDSDGVADVQDQCPGTQRDDPVDASGCSLRQR